MNIHTRKIKELIEEAEAGKIVLPNFQREYTYERARQKELIASLFSAIPVGSVLTMKGQSSAFSHRDIGRLSKYQNDGGSHDVTFLLDGQQRMTTFWNILTDIYAGVDREERFSQVHNYLKSRWFLCFKKDASFSEDVWGLEALVGDEDHFRGGLLPSDLESSIVYTRGVKNDPLNWAGGMEVPTEKKDENPREKKYRTYLQKNWLVPIHLITRPTEFKKAIEQIASFRRREIQAIVEELKNGEITFDKIKDEHQRLIADLFEVENQEDWSDLGQEKIQSTLFGRALGWATKITSFAQEVISTDVGVIELGPDALGKAHVVFDAINKSGVKLSAFDLFCASKPKIDVRTSVNDLISGEVGMKSKDTNVASDEFTTQLMNLLRIIDAYNRDEFKQSCLKDDHIFKLSSEELEKFLKEAITSLRDAYILLRDKAGLRNVSEQPYKLQILPVAFAKYLNACGEGDKDILAIYWLAMLGGKYRESQNSRCWSDLVAVRKLKEDGILPAEYSKDGDLWNNILNVEGYNDKESLIPKDEDHEYRQSVNKSILQFILGCEPLDFPGGKSDRISAKDDELELHHILPLGSAKTIGESTKKIRSNKKHVLNSALNLAWISKDSNRSLSAMAFAQYSKEFKGTLKVEYGLPDWPSDCETWDEDAMRIWLEERYEKLKALMITKMSVLVS